MTSETHVERMYISFVPYSDGKYDLIIGDDTSLKEVTLSGFTKDLSIDDGKLLYKLAPPCAYSHYKETSGKELFDYRESLAAEHQNGK